MSQIRRKVEDDPFQTKVTTSGSSHSVMPDEFSQMLTASRLPETVIKQATLTIRNHQDYIMKIVNQVCDGRLPDPNSFHKGDRPVIQIYLTDTSGSEAGHEQTMVDFETIVTGNVMDSVKPRAGVYTVRLVFADGVRVAQPLQKVTEDPRSQVWFTTKEIDDLPEEERPYSYHIKGDGGTNLNLAMVTAFTLAKYLDYYFRKLGIIPKFVIVIKTDGDHNGSLPADHVKAAIQAASEYDNIYVFLVAVGAPKTADYARQIGFHEDSVLEVSKGAEEMTKAALKVSAVAIGASMSAVPASQFHYLSVIEDFLNEVEHEEFLQGTGESNIFDGLFNKAEEVAFEDEEDEQP